MRADATEPFDQRRYIHLITSFSLSFGYSRSVRDVRKETNPSFQHFKI